MARNSISTEQADKVLAKAIKNRQDVTFVEEYWQAKGGDHVYAFESGHMAIVSADGKKTVVKRDPTL